MEKSALQRPRAHVAAATLLLLSLLLLATALWTSFDGPCLEAPPRPSSSAPSSSSSSGSFPGESRFAGYCSHIPPISEEEREGRRARAREEVAALHHDVFVTEPGPSMRYFSDVSWKLSERPFLLVLPVSGPHFFVAPKFEEGKARELVANGTRIVTWEEDQDPFEVLHAALGAPAAGFSVAVEHEARFFIFDGIARAFGTQNRVANGLEVVRSTRGIKSAREMEILACANELTKKIIAHVAAQIVAGMTEDEVAAILRGELVAAGLTNVWHLVLFAENAAFPHGTTQRIRLEEGHLILIDTGGELHGYQSDISRTFAFGQYEAWQKDMWDAVRKAQQAALDAIRPGVPMGDLDKAARDVITSLGFGEGYETFTHRLGHGIGLQGHEEIYAVKGNGYPLREGMCFSVEPGIYIVGKGGVRIEDIACALDSPPYYTLFGPTSDSLDDPFRDHY